MSTLFFAQNRGESPSDPASVRSTITVVNEGEPAATQEQSPDFNQTFTDPDTGGGLTPRQVSSHVVPTVKYVPINGDANTDFSARIDNQISTSGTAAAREASGQWGHGSMKVVEGIEPTIRDGAALGSNYFATYARPDSASGNYLTPSQTTDPGVSALAQNGAEVNSRAAVNQSMYAAYYAAVTGA